MSDQASNQSSSPTSSSPQGASSGGASATLIRKPRTAPPKVDKLPPWNVLLHNDSVNEMGYVVETIIELTRLNPRQALFRMIEAHKAGVALLLTTHREHAELLCEQFASKYLTVTVEPAP